METPDTIPVPVGVLQLILAACRHGLAPKIHWSEDRGRMDRAAMGLRGEALKEIEAQVEELLPEGRGA
jgi:hypothetical protein